MVCNQDVCERWCVTKLCVKHGVQQSCVCETRCATKLCVCVTKLCVRISARPATQNEGGCRQLPRLPRETKVDVAKCHACHAKCKWMSPSAALSTQKCRGVTRDQGAPSATQPCVRSTTPATQNEGGCHQAPRLPREKKVDVTKCRACHAKVPRRHARPRGPKGATRPSHLSEVPHLPRKTKVPRRHARPGGHKRATRPSHVSEVSRLPCKTKVGVTKCHACHVKRRWKSPSAVPATQKSRGVTRDQGAPSVPPDPAMCQKYHACHAKRRWMSPSATPATQNEGGCHQVPRLPRKCRGVTRDQGGPQACHQTQPSPTSATPAT